MGNSPDNAKALTIKYPQSLLALLNAVNTKWVTGSLFQQN